MFEWLKNLFPSNNIKIESMCPKVEQKDKILNYKFAKIWSRYPIYCKGSKATVWLNLTGYEGDVYIGLEHKGKIYTVNSFGSLLEGVHLYIKNYKGNLIVNQKVIEDNNLQIPEGNYELFLIITRRNESPKLENNIILKKSTIIQVTEDKDKIIQIMQEKYDKMRGKLAEQLVDPDIKLDDTNSVLDRKAKLVNNFTYVYGNYADIHMADSKFRYVSEGFMEYLLALCEVKYRKYKFEDHDCDDFSFALQGYLNNPRLSSGGFFVVWGRREDGSGGHAVNAVALLKDKNESSLKIIEPQTGQMKEPSFMDQEGNKWKAYLIVG